MEEKKIPEYEEMHKVLDFALDAGRILLKSGAEIFRVEETIDYICKRYHIKEVDTFVLSNGIFITAEKEGKEMFAKVKHIPLSGTHLGIVTAVNDLSREVAARRISLDEAIEKLKEIEQMPPKKRYFRILAAGMGSGGFCYLLQASLFESVVAFVIGILLYTFVTFTEKHPMSKVIVNIVGAGLVTVLALFVCNVCFPFLRRDKIIIGSILPLVPGVAFTNAIRDIARSDFISGTVRMIDAILVFVYVAIGVGVVLTLYQNMLGGFAL